MKRLAALLALLPLPAFAHHAMGGVTPSTTWQGLVSGLAHPVIGLDHLAFLLAAGVLAAALPPARGLLAILAFVAGGFLGSLIHMAGIGLGPVEAMVALSVLAAGLALMRGVPAAVLPAAFAVAGLVHGHAFAESIIGAEAGAVVAYLLGLAVIQAAIGGGVAALARRLEMPGARRIAGAAASVAGLAFLFVALAA
jgi:urease accessory protein